MVARFIIPALLLPAMMAAQPFQSSAHAATGIGFGWGAITSHTYDFAGLEGHEGTDDAAARLTLTLFATTPGLFVFSYNVENLAGGDFDRARLSGFGFDADPNAAWASSTGGFTHVSTGTVNPGFSTRLCFNASGGGCNSNGNAGLSIGQRPASGLLAIGFSQPQDIVTLSNAYVRWQGLRSREHEMNNAAAISHVSAEMFEPAPEPATWTMMIAGFGLIGASVRRQTTLRSCYS